MLESSAKRTTNNYGRRCQVNLSRCIIAEVGGTVTAIHSFIYFAFINYSTKLKLIIIHLAGSPGSYFAYLKDCLKKRSKKLECRLSVAEQKY